MKRREHPAHSPSVGSTSGEYTSESLSSSTGDCKALRFRRNVELIERVDLVVQLVIAVGMDDCARTSVVNIMATIPSELRISVLCYCGDSCSGQLR